MHASQVLHKVKEFSTGTMHLARRQALEAVVRAAVRGRRVSVKGLGRAMESKVAPKHCIKRADRLLSNRDLHEEGFGEYVALGHRLIGSTRRPVIVVDWSDLDACKRHFLLRAAVPMGGRTLSVYEEVHRVKTKEKPKTHKEFLARLHKVLPQGCRPIVITDTGFRTPWFKQVECYGWQWVGRVRHRHKIQYTQDGEGVECKSLYPQASRTPKAIGCVRLTQSNPLTSQLVLYKAARKGRVKNTRFGQRARAKHSEKNAARAREPWLLATSLPVSPQGAAKVVKVYASRMQIEEAFRDLKSSRFGLSLEYSGTRQLQRLRILVLIASVAIVVLWLVGKATQLTQHHRHYQANTVRNRVVLSTLFIGLQVINDPRVNLRKADVLAAAKVLQNIAQAPMSDY